MVKTGCGSTWLAVLVQLALAGPMEEADLEGVRRNLAEADQVLSGMEAFVREQGVRMEAAQPVAGVDLRALERVQVLLDGAAGMSGQENDPWWQLNARLDEMKSAAARLGAAVAGNTRLRPDAYAGADAAKLKAIAESSASAAEPGLGRIPDSLTWVRPRRSATGSRVRRSSIGRSRTEERRSPPSSRTGRSA